MVNDQTFALPLAQPATTLSYCFQPRGFADTYLRKSLKKNDLYPPPISFPHFFRSRGGLQTAPYLAR